MGRFEVRTTTPLGVTATEAWDYLMSHDEWRLPHVPVVTKLTEGPTTVGSRFENRVRGGGRSWTVINEITHIEPPERLSWRQVNDGGPTRTLEGHYLLESAGGRSMFTLHTVLETRGARLRRGVAEPDHPGEAGVPPVPEPAP